MIHPRSPLGSLEGNCKGRFWEARFKSRALLNEATLLSCMVYVVLDPFESGISSSYDR